MELIHIANATFSSLHSKKPRNEPAENPLQTKCSLEMGVKTKNVPDC